MDLAARQQALQQRYQQLIATIHQLEAQLQQARIETWELTGALKVLAEIEREPAEPNGARLSPQGRAYVADGT